MSGIAVTTIATDITTIPVTRAIAPTPNTVTAIIRAVRNRFSASCWISTERGRSSLEIGIVQPKLTASSCRFNDRREEFYETHIFVPGHQPCRIDHPV